MKACGAYSYYPGCRACQRVNEVKEDDMTTKNPEEIVIDGATYKLVAPGESPPNSILKVGDFVKTNNEGEYGKVVELFGRSYVGVEFPRFSSRRWNLDGRVRAGHGFRHLITDVTKVD